MIWWRRRVSWGACVYIAREEAPVIVCTEHETHEGVRFEGEDPVVLGSALDAATLGDAVLSAMRHSDRRRLNLREARPNRSDSPAYRASGLHSMRQFEERFIALTVRDPSGHQQVLVVSGLPEPDSELSVESSVSVHAPAIARGECILRVFRACRDRRV